MKISYLLLFVPFLLFGQKFADIRSLQERLERGKNDEQRLRMHLELIEVYRQFNPDSCLSHTRKAEQLIQKHQWDHFLGSSLLGYVYYYADKNDLQKALGYNRKSFEINKRNKNLYTLANNYVMFARLYHQKGDHPLAVKNYLQAIDMGQKHRNMKAVNYAYRSLAFLYLDESDSKKALSYISKATTHALENKIETDLAFAYGVNAEIYRSLGEFAKAAPLFTKSYQLFKKENDLYGLAWLYTNWSLLDLKDLNKSLKMQLEAQKIWDSISPNHYMSVANHYNLAYTYLDFYRSDSLKTPYTKKQLKDLAYSEMKTSGKIANANKNMQWVMFNYLGLSEIDYEMRDLDNYRNNFLRYINIKDSLYSQSRKNEIARVESQKVIDLKNRELKLNQIIIRNKENEKWYYLGIILLISATGMLMWYFYRRSRMQNMKLLKLNAELDEANKNKVRFFGILNHDLRSPVSSLINFLHLQREAPEMFDEETRERLNRQTTSSAENLLAQMEDLLLWAKSQMEKFEAEKEFLSVEQIFSDLKKEFEWAENAEIIYRPPGNLKIFSDKEFLKTILRNLIANAVKILEGRSNAKIWVEAEAQADCIKISVRDNGGGASSEKFRALYDDQESPGIKNGLGMHVIRDLSKAIGAAITVESSTEKGETKISLSVKKL